MSTSSPSNPSATEWRSGPPHSIEWGGDWPTWERPRGQYSAFRFSYVSLGTRALGAIVDGLGTLLLPATVFLIGTSKGESELVACTNSSGFPIGGMCRQPTEETMLLYGGGSLLLYVVLWFLLVVRPTATTGQSIGARLFGYAVVDAVTGAPIGYLGVVLRGVVASLTNGFSCMYAHFHEKNQTWHDLAVGSVVVLA